MPGGTRINLTSANWHVPDIERHIIFVKEIKRDVSLSLSFNNAPKLLTVCIVFTVVMMLNYFLVKGGVSAILSTKIIILGGTLHYKWHLVLKIGQYCQVHEYEYPRNIQVPRTKGAICLGPSGN